MTHLSTRTIKINCMFQFNESNETRETFLSLPAANNKVGFRNYETRRPQKHLLSTTQIAIVGRGDKMSL